MNTVHVILSLALVILVGDVTSFVTKQRSNESEIQMAIFLTQRNKTVPDHYWKLFLDDDDEEIRDLQNDIDNITLQTHNLSREDLTEIYAGPKTNQTEVGIILAPLSQEEVYNLYCNSEMMRKAIFSFITTLKVSRQLREFLKDSETEDIELEEFYEKPPCRECKWFEYDLLIPGRSFDKDNEPTNISDLIYKSAAKRAPLKLTNLKIFKTFKPSKKSVDFKISTLDAAKILLPMTSVEEAPQDVSGKTTAESEIPIKIYLTHRNNTVPENYSKLMLTKIIISGLSNDIDITSLRAQNLSRQDLTEAYVSSEQLEETNKTKSNMISVPLPRERALAIYCHSEKLKNILLAQAIVESIGPYIFPYIYRLSADDESVNLDISKMPDYFQKALCRECQWEKALVEFPGAEFFKFVKLSKSSANIFN